MRSGSKTTACLTQTILSNQSSFKVSELSTAVDKAAELLNYARTLAKWLDYISEDEQLLTCILEAKKLQAEAYKMEKLISPIVIVNTLSVSDSEKASKISQKTTEAKHILTTILEKIVFKQENIIGENTPLKNTNTRLGSSTYNSFGTFDNKQLVLKNDRDDHPAFSIKHKFK